MLKNEIGFVFVVFFKEKKSFNNKRNYLFCTNVNFILIILF